MKRIEREVRCGDWKALGQRLGEQDVAQLGGAVLLPAVVFLRSQRTLGCIVYRAIVAHVRSRRQVHHAASFRECRKEKMREQKVSEVIRLELRFKAVFRDGEWRIHNARIVHQHVQRATKSHVLRSERANRVKVV